ncbi:MULTISPECIES: CDP-alcohol phosphatidyltransferase family protein [Sphingomonas]|uniref:CDP-alcohol phosphatidyltransferase family protein n=1 Tax=Sphingomonas TaxID=13687 RepID=UPI000DF01DAD|nr:MULTISPECIES: CDP-alcohol phosphatidyltransferase family protein [Sphingomonas]
MTSAASDPADFGSRFAAARVHLVDPLPRFVWRTPALALTRAAAAAGLHPLAVTLAGLACCVVAALLFWRGHLWWGGLSALAYLLLDSVDGTLARVTGQVSQAGNWLDRGIDFIAPPFWWWAWVHGLGAAGHQMEEVYKGSLLLIMVGGHVVGLLIEGWFRVRFGLQLHDWQVGDRWFRMIAARRDSLLVILLLSLVAGRPDLGVEVAACWALVSTIILALRLAQAEARADRGETIRSSREAEAA